MKEPASDTLVLVDLVRRMRTAQKAYFATHASSALRESRDLEKRVDSALDELLGGKQKGIFDGTYPTEQGPAGHKDKGSGA